MTTRLTDKYAVHQAHVLTCIISLVYYVNCVEYWMSTLPIDDPTSQEQAEVPNKKNWTNVEDERLIDYIETNCIVPKGGNFKAAVYNGAAASVRTKDAKQCSYRWKKVCILHDSDA